MKITIEYGTQVRVASGVNSEQLDLAEGSTAAELLKQVRVTREDSLSTWLTDSGQPRPGLLVFINDRSTTALHSTILQDGDQVALLTLVSGG